uniref:Uncharacterized protein n=1 Tax=Syphacia muris TaxID=451379 RepID=A0A0N5AEW8_9BILA
MHKRPPSLYRQPYIDSSLPQSQCLNKTVVLVASTNDITSTIDTTESFTATETSTITTNSANAASTTTSSTTAQDQSNSDTASTADTVTVLPSGIQPLLFQSTSPNTPLTTKSRSSSTSYYIPIRSTCSSSTQQISKYSSSQRKRYFYSKLKNSSENYTPRSSRFSSSFEQPRRLYDFSRVSSKTTFSQVYHRSYRCRCYCHSLSISSSTYPNSTSTTHSIENIPHNCLTNFGHEPLCCPNRITNKALNGKKQAEVLKFASCCNHLTYSTIDFLLEHCL